MQPGQVVTLVPQPVQVQVPSQVHVRTTKHSYAVKSLGILQMIIAGLSIMLGIAILIIGSYFPAAGSGIGGGLLLYFPAGILGVLSVKAPASSRKGLTIACMVMSILSAIVAVANTGFISYEAIVDSGYIYNVPLTVFDSLLALLSFVEILVAIIASVYCCLVMSESNSPANTWLLATPQTNPVMINQPPPPAYYVPSEGPTTKEPV